MTIASSTGALKGSPTVAATGRWSVANNLLKEVYQFPMRDIINNKTVLLSYLNMRADLTTEGGEYFVVPLTTGRENGHNAITEDGALPDPINLTNQRATYDVRFYPGRFKVSGRSMSSTASTRGAFLRQFEYKATALSQSMARDLNRQLYGDGSGRLCLVTVGAGATSLTVANPGGFTNSGPGTQYLEEGMRVCFVSAAGVLRAGPHTTITAINRDTNVITISPAVAAQVVGDAVVRVSNTSTTSINDTAWMKETNGLSGVIWDLNPFNGGTATDGLIGQLSRETSGSLVTVPRWKSPVRGNGGVAVPLIEDFLNQIQDDIDNASGESVQMFLSTHGLRRALVALQVGAKRFTSLVLESGYRSIAHNGIPFIPDRDCTKGRIYAVNFDHLDMAVEDDWSFEDRDGAVLNRMPDQHSFQVLLYRWHNLVTGAPNTMGRVEDLQDDF